MALWTPCLTGKYWPVVPKMGGLGTLARHFCEIPGAMWGPMKRARETEHFLFMDFRAQSNE